MVADGQNNALTPTYLKRARQLVKKGRARWVAEDTICLLQQLEEENIVASDKTEQISIAAKADAAAQINNDPPPQAETPLAEDSALRDLAKRRLTAKRSLRGQFFDFLLLVFCAFVMVNADYDESVMVAFLLCIFWGLRLAFRVFKFAKPAFKEGVAAYFRRRKEQQLELEYGRLKQMSKEYVAEELSK